MLEEENVRRDLYNTKGGTLLRIREGKYFIVKEVNINSGDVYGHEFEVKEPHTHVRTIDELVGLKAVILEEKKSQ